MVAMADLPVASAAVALQAVNSASGRVRLLEHWVGKRVIDRRPEHLAAEAVAAMLAPAAGRLAAAEAKAVAAPAVAEAASERAAGVASPPPLQVAAPR